MCLKIAFPQFRRSRSSVGEAMRMLKDEFMMQIIAYSNAGLSARNKENSSSTGLHVPAKKWEECALTRKYMRFVQQKTRVQDQFSEEFFKNHASNSRIDTFTIKMTFMTDELLCDLMKWIGDGEVVIRGLSMEDVRPYFEEELFNRYLKFINPRLLCWRASMEDGAKSPCIIVPQKCQLLDVANAQVDLTNSNQLEYVILRDVHQESQRLFMQGIFDNQFPKLKAALLCVDSIGQRQENLWSNKQWKAIGFKIRTLYSRQPGAHTIHDIRRIDSKWMDKDRVIQYGSFVTETFISAGAASSASHRLKNFANERPTTRSLSWKGIERRRSSSGHRYSDTLDVDY